VGPILNFHFSFDPSLRQLLVDWAQIFSAFGTVLAAVVALYLARRTERPRPRFFVRRRTDVTVSVFPQGGPEAKSTELHYLALSVANAGVMPIWVTGMEFQVAGSGGKAATTEQPYLPTGELAAIPQKLEHGEQIHYHVRISADGPVWYYHRRYSWIGHRPCFAVHTSLGDTHLVKVGFRLCVWLDTVLSEMRRNRR